MKYAKDLLALSILALGWLSAMYVWERIGEMPF